MDEVRWTIDQTQRYGDRNGCCRKIMGKEGKIMGEEEKTESHESAKLDTTFFRCHQKLQEPTQDLKVRRENQQYHSQRGL